MNYLHEAATNGDSEKVKSLLKDSPKLVSSRDERRRTPLHIAAELGDRDVAQLLLARKADVGAKDNGGATPLHMAATAGHTAIAELLVASKANVQAKDNRGNTPLHCAARLGREDTVEFLLACRAEVDARNYDGETPLHRAVAGGHKAVAKLLLSRGAGKGIEGRAASQLASLLDRGEAPEFPETNRAGANAKDNIRAGPLDTVALKGREAGAPREKGIMKATIVGQGATLWSAPGLEAQRVAELKPWSEVEVFWVREEGGKKWMRVMLADGRRGFVADDKLTRFSSPGTPMGTRAEREFAWGYVGKGLGTLLGAGIATVLTKLLTDRWVVPGVFFPIVVLVVLYGAFQLLRGLFDFLVTLRDE